MKFRVTIAAAILVAATLGMPAQAASASVHVAAKQFANCTALNKTYHHGVGRSGARDHVKGSSKPVTNFKVSTALYNANKKSDRDKDGVACEKR